MTSLPNPAMPILYVHGAGQQFEAEFLKRVLDSILVGKLNAIDTRLAYFADVRYEPRPAPSQYERVAAHAESASAGPIALAHRPAPGAGARPIRVESPADAIAVFASEQQEPEYLLGTISDLARSAAERADIPEAARPAAGRLAERMIRRASAPITIESVNVPDGAFRLILKHFAEDVLEYFWNDEIRDAMRKPVRDAIKGRGIPFVLIAHSLGSIISFDILAELGEGVPSVDLVTAGSPLGIEDVQTRLVGGSKAPVRPPTSIRTWHNFAAARDPVALSRELNGDYAGITIDDHGVDLPGVAPMEHALEGYLALPSVKAVAIKPREA